MGFARAFRTPTPTRTRDAIFAVGGLVEVAGASDRSLPVTLTDEGGTKAIANLGDGTSVAILAWRPGWAGNTRYCVRTTKSGVEGWLSVGNLRRMEAVVAAPKTAPAAPTGRPARPRVGEARTARPPIRAR